MKKLINIGMLATMVLMVSCHARKKVEDLHIVSSSKSDETIDSARVITDHKITHADNSRVEHSDSTVSSSKDVFDLTFYLKGKPFKLPVDSAGTGERDVINGMISQALANSDSAKVHVERVRNERKGSKTVDQKAVKDTGTAHQVAKAVSAHTTEDKKLDKTDHTEVKTTFDFALIGWVLAIFGVVAGGIFIHKKLFSDANGTAD